MGHSIRSVYTTCNRPSRICFNFGVWVHLRFFSKNPSFCADWTTPRKIGAPPFLRFCQNHLFSFAYISGTIMCKNYLLDAFYRQLFKESRKNIFFRRQCCQICYFCILKLKMHFSIDEYMLILKIPVPSNFTRKSI